MQKLTLAEIAFHIDAELVGDADFEVDGIAALSQALAGQVSFLAEAKYRKQLSTCQASAMILSADEAKYFSGHKLIVANPYLAYALVAALFDNRPDTVSGIHSTAVVSSGATLGEGVSIAAFAVIADGACLEAGCVVGAHSVVGEGCVLGEGSRLASHVTLYHGVKIGKRANIHSGVVIGSDGFGFANDQGKWIKIPQIGGVSIGDDVEIGANTTIDRGALDDTLIGNGVKMDNQIQVAHNVQIGDHTAIAGCVGIAGSAKIGRHCGIGGGAGILGHLEITDGVQVTAMSLVTKSIKQSGIYSSGTSVEPFKLWHRNYARFGQLDDMARRLKALEQRLEKNKE
ncbi:MAG: UDP-3-O-(3-hydroxymyristoyl)glucosamine N-acyltransferase [Gammaproteobacteria bacterium]|nr:UDP-3-O-(3-hydroxymyristoyl)glucosamine N-acyltransferase [Gammaproteobacteria bacterium]